MKRTPLKRGKPLARAKRLSPRSAKREDEAAERFIVRERVFARDGHRCQMPAVLARAGRSSTTAGVCAGVLTFHHLRKASACGPYTEANGMALCAAHNSWVETEPYLARSLGLVR